MRYQWIHDCERPDMYLGKEENQYERGWWIFKKVVTETSDIYETKTIRWNCPVCQSQWEYHGSWKYAHGLWICLQRPEVWRDYDEVQ